MVGTELFTVKRNIHGLEDGLHPLLSIPKLLNEPVNDKFLSLQGKVRDFPEKLPSADIPKEWTVKDAYSAIAIALAINKHHMKMDDIVPESDIRVKLILEPKRDEHIRFEVRLRDHVVTGKLFGLLSKKSGFPMYVDNFSSADYINHENNELTSRGRSFIETLNQLIDITSEAKHF